MTQILTFKLRKFTTQSRVALNYYSFCQWYIQIYHRLGQQISMLIHIGNRQALQYVRIQSMIYPLERHHQSSKSCPQQTEDKPEMDIRAEFGRRCWANASTMDSSTLKWTTKIYNVVILLVLLEEETDEDHLMVWRAMQTSAWQRIRTKEGKLLHWVTYD